MAYTRALVNIAEPSYSGFQTLCLEDADNCFAQVRFTGRAMKLKTFGYPKSAKIMRMVDGDIEGVEIDQEPPSAGTYPLDTYSTTNGKWSHKATQVQCDEDSSLPPTEVVIKNFVIWWKYEKTISSGTTVYYLVQIIQVGMPACVHLGLCQTSGGSGGGGGPSAHGSHGGPKRAKAKKSIKRSTPKKALKRSEEASK